MIFPGDFILISLATPLNIWQQLESVSYFSSSPPYVCVCVCSVGLCSVHVCPWKPEAKALGPLLLLVTLFSEMRSLTELGSACGHHPPSTLQMLVLWMLITKPDFTWALGIRTQLLLLTW